MTRQFDVLVIGSGPAGGIVAKTCRKAGLRVAVAEKNGFGGVCPLRGCEPKKTLVDASNLINAVRRMRQNGVSGEVALHWPELLRFKRGFTDPIPEKVRNFYLDQGITPLQGECVFKAPREMLLRQPDSRETTTLRAEHIVLAVGAKPRELNFAGVEFSSDSSAFLDLENLPESLVFLGGGYIAFELAMVAATAGAKVSIATHGDRFLRAFDPDLVDRLLQACDNIGIELLRNAPAKSLEKTDDGLTLHLQETSLRTDMVVNATGRIPDTQGLELEKAGLRTEKHALLVDEAMRCQGNPAIFAAGDCASRGAPLTPVAAHQAEVAAANILHDLGRGGAPEVANERGVPTALFTDPPMARVGLLQSEVEQEGLNYEIFSGDAAGWSEYRRLGQRHAGYKILARPGDGLLLGGHFLGEGAEEMANLLGLAMRQGVTVADLRKNIWAYPSHAYTLRYMLG